MEKLQVSHKNKAQQILPDQETSLMINVRDCNDHTSFVILFHKSRKRISKYIYRRTNSLSDTDSLCQEVFSRLWLNRHKFLSDSKFQTYLFGIAANVVSSFNRQRLKERSIISIEYASPQQTIEIKKKLSDSSQPQDRLIAEELLKQAHSAIANLPVKCRTVFKLIVEQGHTIKKASERMGCSEASVRRYYDLAVRKLKQQLSAKEQL